MGRLTTRQGSLVHPGLGQHVVSPKKRQRFCRISERAPYRPVGKKARLDQLQHRLDDLMSVGRDGDEGGEQEQLATIPEEAEEVEQDMPMMVDSDEGVQDQLVAPCADVEGTKRKSGLDQKVRVARFFERWQELLPDMQLPLLQYLQETLKHAAPISFNQHIYPCGNAGCASHRKEVLMLFWDRKHLVIILFIHVSHCSPRPRDPASGLLHL